MKKILSVFLALIILVSITSCNGTVKKYQFNYQFEANDYRTEMYYHDSFFDEPSNVYNPSLATASMSLSWAAFASSDSDYSKKSKNADALLKSMGYVDVDANKYFKENPGTDTLGCIFGHKEINGKQMIACGIRGGNYGAEWASNVTVGKDDTYKQYHQGFYEGSIIFLNSLIDYINDKQISGEIMLWIVGYSRGGAVCNISAGILDEAISKNEHVLSSNVSISKDDLYAYCFEAPQGVYCDDNNYPRSEVFNNIFCIVNPNDPVPKIIMNEFSFTRYGVDKILFDNVNDINYENDIKSVIKFFNSYDNSYDAGEDSISKFEMKRLQGGKLVSSSEYCNWSQGIYLDDIMSHVALYGLKSREYYADEIQEGIREILGFVFSKSSASGSMTDLLLSIAKSSLLSDSADLLIDDLLYNQSKLSIDFEIVLMRALESLDVDVSKEAIVNSIKKTLLAVVSMIAYDWDFGLLLPLLSGSNIKGFAQAHRPELTLAYLRSMDPLYNKKAVQYDLEGKYYCIEIMDTSANICIKYQGDEIVKFVDGQPIDTESTISYARHRKLRIYLPCNNLSDYEIESSSSDISVFICNNLYEDNQKLDVHLINENDYYSFVIPAN